MTVSLPFRSRRAGWLLVLALLASRYVQAQAPANDLCANAVTISCGQSLTGSTSGATNTGDPNGNCGNGGYVGGPGVLYRFVGTGEVATVSLCGPATNYDTKLHVFSGSCGSFTCVTSNDDACGLASEASFFGTAGTTYYILVNGYNGSTGNFSLGLTCAPPADLLIDDAQSISGTYRNVTVAPGGSVELSGPLTVTGTFTVQDSAALDTRYEVLTGNSFVLQAGAELTVRSEDGLSASGATGSIQTTTRSFSDDASYRYRVDVPVFSSNFTVPTGTGLPTRVRSLDVVMFVDGPAFAPQLQLSNDLSVARKLSLFGNLDPNGHRVTLLSDATAGTALIDNPFSQTFSILGPVTVQRAIDPTLNPGAGYRHLSAPVQGATVASLTTAGFAPVVNPAYNASATPTTVTPFPTVFGYNESRLPTSPATTLSAFDKGWESPAGPTDALTVGRGYTVNIPASSKLSFTGLLTEGNVPLTLTRGAQTDAGWNLIGNPYPAPINWSWATLPAGLDSAMYVYQSTGRYAGGYRSYVNGIGNPVVALGQAFFVRVTQPNTSVNLTLNNGMRVADFDPQPSLQRRRPETRPLVQLTLGATGSSTADETYVYFQPGATAGVDAGYDAVKLQPGGSGVPALWTLAAGAEQAINGLPALTGSTVVPLGLQLPAAGSYTLEAAQLLNLSAATAYLHDAQTGQLLDLSRQPRYTFTAGAAGRLNGRFTLRFEPLRPTASAAALQAASVQVYPNPAHQQFTVQLPAVPGARQVQATLLNALGQEVRRHTAALPAAGLQLPIDVRGLKAGVYVLRLRAGQEELTKRVLIN